MTLTMRAFAALLAVGGVASAAHASVNISGHKTRNFQCESGACVPTAQNAYLNVNDLAGMLAASDIKVFTGNGAVTIQLTAPLSWTSSHRLTLQAFHSVSFKAPVTVAGTGAMTIVTNVADDGGALLFFPGGSVSFWDTASDLVMDGTSYTLEADIPSLAAAVTANPSGAYALAKNYNAFADGIYLHAPIATTFAGTFEGLGNTVDKLSIANPTGDNDHDIGLFAQTGSGSLIRDINLTNLSITNAGQHVGGLAGQNGGTIFNATSAGTISVGGTAGGLVGTNQGTISSSSSSSAANVTTGTGAGGLVGSGLGTIQFSHATGAVKGSFGAGGLIGYAQGTVSDSYATGAVTTSSLAWAGGLVGTLDGGTVERSFATGAVTDFVSTPRGQPPQHRARFFLGGLVGVSNGTLRDRYAMGAVTGVSDRTQGHQNRAGGLFGTIVTTSQVASVYSTGAVTIDRGFFGGSVGYDLSVQGSTQFAYWDLDASGVSDKSKAAGNIAFSKGFKGRGTTQLTRGLPEGFSNAVWAQNPTINNGYPHLISNPPQ